MMPRQPGPPGEKGGDDGEFEFYKSVSRPGKPQGGTGGGQAGGKPAAKTKAAATGKRPAAKPGTPGNRGAATGAPVHRRRQTPQQRAARRRRILRNRLIAAAIGALVLVLVVVLVVSAIRKAMAAEPSTSLPSSVPISTSLAGPESAPLPGAGYTDSPYHEAGVPLLCNADHPLPEGYEVKTASAGYRDNGQEILLEERAASAFLAMQAAAKENGITLMPYSGYRSHEKQLANYNASINSYISQGHSREEATRLTQEYYAIPGTSEHEAGLAIDINSIETSFERTDAFAWLQEHCADYGFILRYPADGQDTTGIAYEPWHYRYVGINHAKEIQQRGLLLEDYVKLFE